MLRITSLALGAALLMGSATAASAQPKPGCVLVMTAMPSSWTIKSTDPLGADGAVREFDLQLRNDGDKKCQGDILAMIDLPFGLSSGSGNLPYTLDYDGKNITPVTGTSTGAQTGGQLDIGAGEIETVKIRVIIPMSQLPGDGLYTETVNLRFVRRNDNVVVAAAPVPLTFDVSPSTLMGLKGAFTRVGGVPRVDLGELATGSKSLNLQLYVESTRGYQVSVKSDNFGKLVHTTDAEWTVPYSLMFGSNALNISTAAGDSFKTSSAPGMRDDSYPIDIVVTGPVAGNRAGNYSDIVRLTIAPL